MMIPSESPRARYLGHASRGELAYQVDPVTGAPFFYPRLVVPGGSSQLPEWRISSGRGTVYSATCVTKRDGSYNISIIELDEGFRIMSRVEGVPPEQVVIGMRVQVRFVTDDHECYPVFDAVDIL